MYKKISICESLSEKKISHRHTYFASELETNTVLQIQPVIMIKWSSTRSTFGLHVTLSLMSVDHIYRNTRETSFSDPFIFSQFSATISVFECGLTIKQPSIGSVCSLWCYDM